MAERDRHRLDAHRARKVRMRVVEVKDERGTCPNGHRVGDRYLVGSHTPKGVCISAFGSCLPYLIALRWGGSFPWEEPAESITVACPDCEHQVVWRLEAVSRSS